MMNQCREPQDESDDESQCDHSTVTVMISPEEAIRLYNGQLTAHERTEIFQYPEVYYIGSHSNNSQRFGFGDVHEYYNPNDHLMFRYQVCHIFCQRDCGQVLKVYDHKNKYHVAIKVYTKPNDAIKNEIRILEYLRMKDEDNKMNVIHIINHFQFRTHKCIIFELHWRNISYTLRHKREGLRLDMLHCICRKLVDFLNGLYNNKIVHGDFKPENILQSKTPPFIKVIDFSMARFEHELSTTLRLQSLYYRAPEVILGIPYSVAIDMWSLGCILCELFTGSPPFQGNDEFDQLALIVEVLGLPPLSDIAMSTRYAKRINQSGTRLFYKDGDKKRRGPPKSKNLKTILNNCVDKYFVEFVSRCLEVDSKTRMTPSEALQHDWMQRIYEPEHLSSDSESCLPVRCMQKMQAATNESYIKTPNELKDGSFETSVDHADISASGESIIPKNVTNNASTTSESIKKRRISKGKFSGFKLPKPIFKRFTASFSGMIITTAFLHENSTSSRTIPKKNTPRTAEYTVPTKKLRRSKRILKKKSDFGGGITIKKPNLQDITTTTCGMPMTKPIQQENIIPAIRRMKPTKKTARMLADSASTNQIKIPKSIAQKNIDSTCGIILTKIIQPETTDCSSRIIIEQQNTVFSSSSSTTSIEHMDISSSSDVKNADVASRLMTQKSKSKKNIIASTRGTIMSSPNQQENTASSSGIIKSSPFEQTNTACNSSSSTTSIELADDFSSSEDIFPAPTREFVSSRNFNMIQKPIGKEIERVSTRGKMIIGVTNLKNTMSTNRIPMPKPIQQYNNASTSETILSTRSKHKKTANSSSSSTTSIENIVLSSPCEDIIPDSIMEQPISKGKLKATTTGKMQMSTIDLKNTASTSGIRMRKSSQQENTSTNSRIIIPKKTIGPTFKNSSSNRLSKTIAQNNRTSTSGIIMATPFQQGNIASTSRIITSKQNQQENTGSTTGNITTKHNKQENTTSNSSSSTTSIEFVDILSSSEDIFPAPMREFVSSPSLIMMQNPKPKENVKVPTRRKTPMRSINLKNTASTSGASITKSLQQENTNTNNQIIRPKKHFTHTIEYSTSNRHENRGSTRGIIQYNMTTPFQQENTASTSGTITTKHKQQKNTVSTSGTIMTKNNQQENTTITSGNTMTKHNQQDNTASTSRVIMTKNNQQENAASTSGNIMTKHNHQENNASTSGIITTKTKQQENTTSTSGIILTKNNQQENVASTSGNIITKHNQQENSASTSGIIMAKHNQLENATSTNVIIMATPPTSGFEIKSIIVIPKENAISPFEYATSPNQIIQAKSNTSGIIMTKPIEEATTTSTSGITMKNPAEQNNTAPDSGIITTKLLQQTNSAPTGGTKPIQQENTSCCTCSGIRMKSGVSIPNENSNSTIEYPAATNPISQFIPMAQENLVSSIGIINNSTSTNRIAAMTPIQQDNTASARGTETANPILTKLNYTSEIKIANPIQQENTDSTGEIIMTKPLMEQEQNDSNSEFITTPLNRQENNDFTSAASTIILPKKNYNCAIEYTASTNKMSLWTRSPATQENTASTSENPQSVFNELEIPSTGECLLPTSVQQVKIESTSNKWQVNISFKTNTKLLLNIKEKPAQPPTSSKVKPHP